LLDKGPHLLRNVSASSLAFLIRIVISFLFVPFITSVLGDSRYGVWVIIFQTINYFNLLDLGLTSAITRYVSKFLAEKNYSGINRVLSTSSLLYLVVGSAVAGGIYLSATLFFDYFRIGDPVMLEEGRRALMVLGVFMAFNFYLLPFGNSLTAFHRFDLARGLAVAEEVLRTIVMVWLLREGYGLVALALTLVGFTVVRHLVAAVWLHKLYPQVRFSLKSAGRESATMLFRYSRVSFAIIAGWMIIFNTDSFLLGLISSSAAAGVYHPGAQLLLYLRNAVNAVAQPLTPAVSHLETTVGVGGVTYLYLRSLRYASYLSFVLCTGVVLFARGFVSLWLAPEFAAAADVMIILAVGSSVFLPQIIGNSVLFGIGKHRYVLYVVICEAIAKIILALLLIGPYGLIGMALAAAVPQLLLYLTLYPWFMARVLNLSCSDLLTRCLGPGLLAVIVSGASGWAMRYLLPPSSWGLLVVDVAVVLVVTLLVGWRLLLPEDRARLLQRVRPKSD
jgi:O-antigen/teichoic acid export membrane protein